VAQPNFLRSSNPFDLTDPPKWFLQELAKFDADLVIFASLWHPIFKLARRCRRSPGVAPENVPGLDTHPDTIFMWNHKLVLVTTIIPRAHWSTNIFAKLRARDTWAEGGSAKVIKLLEDGEAAKEQREKKDFNSEGEARHSDAFAAYRYRTGGRVSMAHKGAAKTKQARPQIYDRAPSKPLVQLAQSW